MTGARSRKSIIIPTIFCFTLALAPTAAVDLARATGLTIEAEENEVHVELVTSAVEFVHTSSGSSRWSRPVLPGYEHDWIREPGHPMLPVKVLEKNTQAPSTKPTRR